MVRKILYSFHFVSNRRFINMFFFLVLFLILPLNLIALGYSCPDSNPDVICYDGSVCPSGYEHFSSELKCDPSYRCCIKKVTDQCPYPAFCSTEDLGGAFSGYKKAGGGSCVTGTCWVFTLSVYNECTPAPPDYCKCASNDMACTWEADCGSLGSGEFCWKCSVSTMCNTTVDECTLANERECRDGIDAGACDGDYSVYVNNLSCGVSGKVCCQKPGTYCSSPAECLTSCPPATHNPVQGIACEDPSLKCCLTKPSSKNPGSGDPADMAYKGPIIDSLEKILGPVTKMLYYGGLFIGIAFIVFSGYKLMISQGNPRNTQEAQEQLTAAILGIIFILLSAAILRIILSSIFDGGPIAI